MKLVVRCAPGLESFVTEELKQLGLSSAKSLGDGRVACSKTESTLGAVMRTNLWLRTASRVILELGRFKCRDFGALYNGARRIDWARFCRGAVNVKVASRKSKLYHKKAVAERIEAAVRKSVGASTNGENRGTIFAELADDECVVYIDTSGEPLHARGWRGTQVGKAPLKSTAAAALLNLAGWPRQGDVLGDPFCGSGTIVLEAASIALGLAPGLGRHFAFEQFPDLDYAAWREHVARGKERTKNMPGLVARGCDRDEGAVFRSRAAAIAAGLDDVVHFAHAALSDAFQQDGNDCIPGPTVVVTNPPHFRRLSTRRDPRNLYSTLGYLLRTRLPPGAPCTFLLGSPPGLLRPGRLASNAQLLGQLGFQSRLSYRFLNGGDWIAVYQGEVGENVLAATN